MLCQRLENLVVFFFLNNILKIQLQDGIFYYLQYAVNS